uniref:Uncharacterized protein n=1 Tax=Hucho hucho TaxID=62062 RepID=A0A4W5KUR6_9TELE
MIKCLCSPLTPDRMLKETLCVLLLWASLEETQSRGCSSFFCRKSHLVSALSRGSDPGKPLFLTPYLEKGNIEEHGSRVW